MRATRQSVIGGLVGLVLSEIVIHIGQAINGQPVTPQFRLTFDTAGYAMGSTAGAVVALFRDSGDNSRLDNVHSLKDLKPTVAVDYLLMAANVFIPIYCSIINAIDLHGHGAYSQ